MSLDRDQILRAACVQLNTQDDIRINTAEAARMIAEAAGAGARLVALPETWNYKGAHADIVEAGETLEGPSSTRMSKLAAEFGIFLLAGSVYERIEGSTRLYNTSLLFGPDGARLAIYRKIHLFDVTAGAIEYRESDVLERGREVVLASAGDVRLGMSICYDLRFPELYLELALQGADILCVPSAFTAYTGKAHWEVLLRARAVENGCFVVAPDQVGFHAGDRECWGHSMIVDPWGQVLAMCEDGPGICVADLDLGLLKEVRASLPSLRHRQPSTYGPRR